MDNLTQKEKKSIIIKLVVSMLLFIAMIIIGLVLTVGNNITKKLKGEVASVDEKAASTCDDLISDNYGYITFRSPNYNDADLERILPVTLTFTDRDTKAVYTKVITIKDIECFNCDDKKIMVPSGNYDIKVTKPGYLYNYYEDTTIKPNSEIYLYSDFFDLVTGDLNGDGLVNDKDLIEPEEKIQNINSWYKKGSLYTGEYIIDQEDFELTYGQVKQLNYHTSEYFKKTYQPSWHSTNSKVAKVENGLVTPLSVGTTKINIDNSNYINVSVIERGSILLEENEITMNGIETKQIKYSYSSDNTFGDSKPTFVSSNTSVVMVNENGELKSLKKGSATITVKAGFNTTATIKVTVNDVPAEDFEIAEEKLTFDGYEQKQISVKPVPENATVYNYKYEVVDDTYASVTTDGLVTSKKSGSTRVKVTLIQEEKEISRYVDVKINYVATESITYKNNITLDGAVTENIEVTYNPSNGLDRQIIATSDDVYEETTHKILRNVTTSDGNIKAVSSYPGNATINFNIDREQGTDLTGVINVIVNDVPLTGVSLSGGGYWPLTELNMVINLKGSPYNYTGNHSIGTITSATSSNTNYAKISRYDSYSVYLYHGINTKGSSNICVKTSTGKSACTTVYRN